MTNKPENILNTTFNAAYPSGGDGIALIGGKPLGSVSVVIKDIAPPTFTYEPNYGETAGQNNTVSLLNYVAREDYRADLEAQRISYERKLDDMRRSIAELHLKLAAAKEHIASLTPTTAATITNPTNSTNPTPSKSPIPLRALQSPNQRIGLTTERYL